MAARIQLADACRQPQRTSCVLTLLPCLTSCAHPTPLLQVTSLYARAPEMHTDEGELLARIGDTFIVTGDIYCNAHTNVAARSAAGCAIQVRPGVDGQRAADCSPEGHADCMSVGWCCGGVAADMEAPVQVKGRGRHAPQKHHTHKVPVQGLRLLCCIQQRPCLGVLCVHACLASCPRACACAGCGCCADGPGGLCLCCRAAARPPCRALGLHGLLLLQQRGSGSACCAEAPGHPARADPGLGRECCRTLR